MLIRLASLITWKKDILIFIKKTTPFLIVLFFYLLSLFLSQKIEVLNLKEIFNAVIILFLVFFASTYDTNEFDLIKVTIIKYFLVFLSLIGLFALIHFVINYNQLFSLVSDYNIYSLYFFYGLILLISNIKNRIFHNGLNLLFFLIYLMNIILSYSRRAYILFFLLIIVYLLWLIFSKNKDIIIYSFFKRGLIAFLVLMSFVTVFFYINFDFNKDNFVVKSITVSLYRINTIFDTNKSYTEFYNVLWKSEINKLHHDEITYWNTKPRDKNSLFYNGDFTNGKEFWSEKLSENDSVKYEILEEKGLKFLRVSKYKGSGFWPLLYKGREIYYHKGRKYTFNFKCRVIKGDGFPFHIGWWINDDNKIRNNLNKEIKAIDKDWYLVTCSYTFKGNQHSMETFMNSQKEGTIVDFADIELICDDTSDHSVFLDQYVYNITQMEMPEFAKEQFSSSRIDRWKYAFNIWQTKYKWNHKLFGHGFDYLGWYGDKFYNDPKRLDYPHNPIISSLLFSGIFGCMFYIYFLILVFLKYWKLKDYLKEIFLMYLVTFYFLMFSGNSHFSVPTFTVLSLLPLIIGYIVENEKNNNKN